MYLDLYCVQTDKTHINLKHNYSEPFFLLRKTAYYLCAPSLTAVNDTTGIGASIWDTQQARRPLTFLSEIARDLRWPKKLSGAYPDVPM